MSFQLDPRLGIRLPHFDIPYEDMLPEEQEDILVQWETIRSTIPDQVMRFENAIERLLHDIHREDNWETITEHFAQISEYASRIAELNTWSRIDPSLTTALEHQYAAEHRDREK